MAGVRPEKATVRWASGVLNQTALLFRTVFLIAIKHRMEATMAAIFDLDGGVTNSTIQYRLSHENQGSGFRIFQYAGASAWHHNTIRYNISENDGTVSAAHAGIYIWNSSDDAEQFYKCIFHNNTIYNSKGSVINFAGQSERKEFFFYNNIFVAGDSLLKGKRTNDIFLANNWWSEKNKFNIEGISNFEAWAKKTGRKLCGEN